MINIRLRSSLFSPLVASAVLLLLLIAATTGCSTSEPAPVTATPQITAADAIGQSQAAMTALESFSFELTHDSGHTTLSGSLNLTRASGLVATNGLDLKAEASIGRAFVKVDAIVIDEQTWMTNAFTGVWSEIAPEDSPFSFLDPVKLVANILGETQHATYQSGGSSRDEIHIAGAIPAQPLAALVGSVDPKAIPGVVLTLDASNFRLKKIVISGVVQPQDEPGYIRVITLSKFNNQTSLEPPI
jgi:hypothetical protein